VLVSTGCTYSEEEFLRTYILEYTQDNTGYICKNIKEDVCGNKNMLFQNLSEKTM
jgi:hypothetical protein